MCQKYQVKNADILYRQAPLSSEGVHSGIN